MTSPHDLSPGPYMVRSGEGVAGFDAAVKASRISTGGNLTVIESHTRAARHGMCIQEEAIGT